MTLSPAMTAALREIARFRSTDAGKRTLAALHTRRLIVSSWAGNLSGTGRRHYLDLTPAGRAVLS